VELLVGKEYYDEAVREMVRMLDDESFQSSRGRNSYQLWTELSDLVCEHSDQLHSVDVDKILRAGIRRFTDEVGRLWNALAKYYILLGNFEKAS
jgi:pre-mRNA-splicing factor SYF1